MMNEWSRRLQAGGSGGGFAVTLLEFSRLLPIIWCSHPAPFVLRWLKTELAALFLPYTTVEKALF
jgi:hypothetical protein